MKDAHMDSYVKDLNKFKPMMFIGQPAPLALLAKYIRDNNVRNTYQLNAVFTQGSKLFQQQREVIEEVFNCRVFETYGLNDGGVSACECRKHNGLHIRTERSILEVVDDDGNQITESNGRILATSIYNYALPFIRYDSEDLGIISDKTCDCGRETRLLQEVTGRVHEYVSSSDGTRIFGHIFTLIFKTMKNIFQFQVVQNQVDEIVISIVPDNWLYISDIDTQIIRNILKEKS